MTDLKECPFCGGDAIVARVHAGGHYWWQIECVSGGCRIVGPTKGTEEEAIAAWNTRTNPDADGLAEALVSEIGKQVADGCACKPGSDNHSRVWLAAQLGVRAYHKHLAAQASHEAQP